MNEKTLVKHCVDVSHLPPPEPMEQILDKLADLKQGEYLHVSHRREPHPLYNILKKMGFNWFCKPLKIGEYEIFIWYKQDKKAEDYFKCKQVSL